ncbi:MAG TPA: plastocyanin/azurin family copper-binding protein [Gemmatimonadales bacterium]|nr:plastocyanin/azurin family copper-binding protein [Gemmatimonadales bacterium]
MMRRSRREFLRAGGLALAGLGLAPDRASAAAGLFRVRPGSRAPLEVIEMRSDALGSRVWFDPIGLYVEPGTTVRWIVRDNVHTTTAYHPGNDQHSLRIPEAATPWDSGFLVNPSDHFDLKLTVPGVYDYYCMPHEAAGMVGRIVVGAASGPGNLGFDYWVGRPGTEGWRPVPDAARRTFPDVERIQAERRVHPGGRGN